MTALQSNAQKELRRLVEKIERIEEERKELASDVRDTLAEAKGKGFDPKIIRKILALRKKTADERAEEDAILDTYMHALGMAGTPLGEYADRQLEEV
jgi:uncharacterized protein (UPF0335 family)